MPPPHRQARKASRLAEVAVEGIQGLNEIVAEQLANAEHIQKDGEDRLQKQLDTLSRELKKLTDLLVAQQGAQAASDAK